MSALALPCMVRPRLASLTPPRSWFQPLGTQQVPQGPDRAWFLAACTPKAQSPASCAAYWQIKCMFPLDVSCHAYRHTMGDFADSCSGGPPPAHSGMPLPLGPLKHPPATPCTAQTQFIMSSHSSHPGLQCSTSLWPQRPWFDSPSAPPGSFCQVSSSQGHFPEPQCLSESWPCLPWASLRSGSIPSILPWVEAPGRVPVARDEGRGWEEACPPAWVKLLWEKKGSLCGPFCPLSAFPSSDLG